MDTRFEGTERIIADLGDVELRTLAPVGGGSVLTGRQVAVYLKGERLERVTGWKIETGKDISAPIEMTIYKAIKP